MTSRPPSWRWRALGLAAERRVRRLRSALLPRLDARGARRWSNISTGHRVDLHHNLAPPVIASRIDAARLWDEATTVSDPYGLSVKVLGPADMLLHNAVHLYMNDELRGGLRDVMDFRDLFEHFPRLDAGFEDQC